MGKPPAVCIELEDPSMWTCAPITGGSEYVPDPPGARFRVVYGMDENGDPVYGPWHFVTTPSGWVTDTSSSVSARLN
ncbi:MAG: hypothetical protein ACPG4T_16935 [Nannocystaceae bacterium]